MNPTPPSHPVVNTSAETFQQDVFDRSRTLPVVVDFWAPWCAPCRALGPVLEKLAAEYAGKFVLVKANTDELPQQASQFNVQGIPAVYAVQDGQIVDFFSGALPEETIRSWLDRMLVAATGLEARRLEESDPAAAEARYRALLTANPNDLDAQVGLGRSLYAQGRTQESQAIVTSLEEAGVSLPELQKLRASLVLQGMQGEDVAARRAAARAQPDDLARQFALAQALAGDQEFPEALEILLSLVQRDKKGIGEQARALMVDIFQNLPEDSDLVSTYRRKLSLALY